MEILLVRHGQTVFNREGRVQGMANSALTPAGVAMATALGKGMRQAGVSVQAAYSSDLTRAVDTARHALAGAGQSLSVHTMPGLREENYGKFEGALTPVLTKAVFGLPDLAAVMAKYSLLDIANYTYAANATEPVNHAETALMVAARFDLALRQIGLIAEAAGHERVLAVAHGASILLWLHAIGFDIGNLTAVGNASVTTLTFERQRFTVKDFNNLAWVQAGSH